MRCAGDPACPFPPCACTGLCAQHETERGLSFTLHEMGCSGAVRAWDDEWEGVGLLRADGEAERLRTARISPQRKLRFKLPERKVRPMKEEVERHKMTEEERRARYSNSYCVAQLPEGRRCNAPIPVKERICAGCLARLLPAPDAIARCPHGYAGPGNCGACRGVL